MGCAHSRLQPTGGGGGGGGEEEWVQGACSAEQPAAQPAAAAAPQEVVSSEAALLRYLGQLGVAGQPAQGYEHVTSIARSVFGVPAAAVVLDADGAGPEPGGGGNFPTLLQDSLVLEDARLDARLKDVPCVAGKGGVRFFAKTPLVGAESKELLGALCLLDTEVRRVSQEQRAMLENLAGVAALQAEREQAARRQEAALQQASMQHRHSSRMLDCLKDAVMVLDPTLPAWPLRHVNDAWVAATGVSRERALRCSGLWQLFEALPGEGEGSEEEAVEAARARAGSQEAFRLRLAPREGLDSRGSSSSAGVEGLAFDFRPSDLEGGLQGSLSKIEEAAAGAAAAAAGGGSPATAAGPAAPLAGGGGTTEPPLASSSDAGVASGGGGGGGVCGHASGSSGVYVAVLQPGRRRRLSDPRFSSATESLASLGLTDSAWTAGSPPLSPPLAGGSLGSRALALLGQSRMAGLSDVRLGQLVGTGTHSRCYSATWHGSAVVVKFWDCCWEDESEGREVAEAVLGCALAHPHLVPTFGHGFCSEEPGEPPAPPGAGRQLAWAVQGFANGGTLCEVIRQGLLCGTSGQQLAALLQTAIELASVLSLIHTQGGLVHADLTPGNVLLTTSTKDARRWIAQVVDVGVAAALGHTKLDSPSSAAHTAPEVLVSGELTPAADVWSWAVLLWELHTGRFAWEGCTAADIRRRVAVRRETLPLPPEAPAWLQGLLRRCLDREPSRRPTFDALLPELTREYRALRRQALKEQRAQAAVLLPGGAPQAAAPPPAAHAAAAAQAAAPAAEEEKTANPPVPPAEQLTRRHRAQVE